MRPESLIQSLSCVIALMVIVGCASNGPQRYRSFFQAVDMARSGEVEQAREAFSAACAQKSSAACHRLGKTVEPVSPLAILQGATSDSATEIIVLADQKLQARFFLWDAVRDKLVEPVSTTPVDLPAGQGRVTQLTYDGLIPVNAYQFQVVGAAGELLDGRDLQTLDTMKKRVSFAVASCMDNRHPLQKQMWEELVSQDPEMIFLIGDNVYADTEVALNTPAPPDVVWKRYFETRRDLQLFRIQRLIPIFAVWDDHDYGVNDGDRTYPYRAESKKIFQAFFGTAEYPGIFDRGPGVSSRLNAFGQRFFFLDARSFRSPVGDRTHQTHFGVDQEAWLFTDLFSSTPAWLISGDQFFGAYHKFESYEGRHPESFARFLRRLKAQSSPVVFLSGDRHSAEFMDIKPEVLGYPTFEVTTSSIHSTVYPDPWKESPNPRQVAGIAGVNNYAIIDADAGGMLSATVKVYGPDKRRLLSRTWEIRR